MKKIALLLTLAIAAIACQKEEILELAEPDQKLVLPAEGGATSMRFTSSTNWTAEIKDADWCKVEPASGTPGSLLIEVTGKANEGEETREAKLVLSSETLVKEVTISQDVKGILNLGEENIYEISMWGEEFAINVNHNLPYELRLPEWITVAETKAVVTDQIMLKAEPQPVEGAERRGSIVISSEAGNVEAIARQEAWVPVLFIEEGAVLEIPKTGGEASFKIKASLDYEVLLSENDWIEINNEGDAYTLKALSPNTSYETREVTVTIKAIDPQYSKVTKTLKVVQACPENIEGQKVEWSTLLTDIKDFNVKKFSSVSKYGNMVLLANSDKVIVLNAKDGTYMNTVTLPKGITAENIVVDAGGHILFCSDVKGDGAVSVYMVTDIQNMKAKEFVKLEPIKLHPNGVKESGNLRVVGDISTNALITVSSICGAHMYGNYCEVKAGVAGEWASTPLAEWDQNVIWFNELGSIISRSTNAADGFYGICYNPGYDTPYNLHFLNTGTQTWSTAFETKLSGRDNFHGMAVADFNNKKYLAIHVGAHFNNSDPKTMLLDITDEAEPIKHYEIKLSKFVTTKDGDQGPENQDWTGGARSSDVSLNIAGDTMYMLSLDVRYNVLSCISFK